MSVRHLSFIECDRCGNEGPQAKGHAGAREAAAELGWIYRMAARGHIPR